MFENRNSRCRNCRFWWPTAETGTAEREHATHGECRCEAPMALLAESPEHKPRYAAWASTRRDDWCGKHMHVST
jgi:hypothetical protein